MIAVPEPLLRQRRRFEGGAANWVDYLQEAKFNGEWKIVNVLWELKPKDATPPK